MKSLPILVLACTQAACASLSTPVPLATALATTERDIRASSPVVLSDLGTAREDSIVAAIQAAQCIKPETPNPLVSVVTGPVSIALQGLIQWQTGATVSPTPSLTFQVTGGKQQQVTVPITFVSASGLPDFYMGQQASNLANMDSGGNDKSKNGADVSAGKTSLVADILNRRMALKALVDRAERDFAKTIPNCKADKYGNYSPPIFPQLQQQ